LFARAYFVFAITLALVTATGFLARGFFADLTATDFDLTTAFFFYANALTFGLTLLLPTILFFVAGLIFPLAILFLSL
jgi:hypothetical protein